MVKGHGEDKSLPSSVNKGRSNLGENSRAKFVENSILEELNRSGNFQSKGVLDSQLELLLLLQNQKQQQRQQNTKDKDSNLSVEEASSASESLIRNPSFGFVDYHTSVSDGEVIDAEVRSRPAYLAYYYSNINKNPRLPPPLLSLEEWRIFQRFQEVGSSTGEYGNWRNKEFVQDGSGRSSLFQMQHGIPSHKAEDDLIEMRKTAARNLSRISSSESMEGSSVFAGTGKSGMGGRRKSFADILQGEPGKSSNPPSRLSRPASYNSLTDMINHGQLSTSTSSGSAFPKFFTAEPGPSVTKIKASEPYRNLKSPPGFPSRSNRDHEENNLSSNSLSPSHKKTEISDIPTSFSGLSASKGQGNAGSPSESTLPLGFSNGHEQTLHQQFSKSGGNNIASLADYMNFMIENEVLLDKNFIHSNYERQMDYPKRGSSLVNLQSLANSPDYSMPGDSKLSHQDDTPKRVASMVDLDSLANSLESIKLAGQNIQGMRLTDTIPKEQSLRSGILGPSNLNSTYEQQNHYLEKSDDCGRSSATVPPNVSRARNVLSTSYSADDLHELGKVYKEAMLSPQKQQDQIPFFYKQGHLNSQYHGNTSSGPYMYQGSPRAYSSRSFAKYGGRLQKEGASCFSNSFKSKEGLSFGSRKSEGKTTVEGKSGSASSQELKNNKYKSLELTEVLNDVIKFSKDQHGSRFIQQRLENANVEEKMKIFSQILPHARELMTDVFGNYIIQKFFENGTESQRRELANQIIGHVLPLSLQTYGCRVTQKALEVIDVEQQNQMVKELDGSVLKCVHDQNGNHVIQKCIECIPQNQIQFIVSSFFGQIVALSTHPYGCRVIQRVLERCDDPHTEQTIMNEIMESICTLAEDQYGNYVIQHVLEHGKPHERSAIIAKLTGQIVKMSQHKFASNVVEKCLIFSPPEERKLIVKEMLGSTEENEALQAMMKDPFGNFVVQKVLETCDDQDRELILSRIRVHLSTLKKYTYGKHIVSRVEKLIEAGERQTEMSTKNSSKDAS